MMKQTLWIISELFYPEETSTGYIMTEIANAMSDKYDVKVICGPEVYDKSKKRDENSNIHICDGIELLRVKGVEENKKNKLSRIWKFIVISRRIYQVAEREIKAGNKVLMVSNPFPLLIMMSRLRRKHAFEFNMLVHDVFPEGMIKMFHLKKPVSSWLMKIFGKSYATVDRLISLGRDMSDLLAKKTCRYGSPEIVVIENWADADGILPTHFDGNGKVVLQYAGNIGTAQRLKDMIDILIEAGNPLLRFELWGSGSQLEYLKQYVEKQGVSEQISFKGTYFRSQQNEVLNACSMALVTLHSDMYGRGVPSKTYNIMAAGKPILYMGPKGSEIGMMVKEEGVGYAFTNDEKQAIVELLKGLTPTSIRELGEMGAKARRLAETRYSRETILRKFVETI